MYIESILLLNIFIHIITSISTSFITSIRISKLRLSITSILDSFYMVIYVYYPEYTLYIKYILGSILSLILFKGSIRGIIIYNSMNILGGGGAYILYLSSHLNIISLVLMFVVLYIFIFFYNSINKASINFKELFYKVSIEYKKQRIELNCYLDTGDFLKSDDLINVIFVNKKYKIGEYKKNNKSRSINVCNDVELYTVDKVYIFINNKWKKRDCYISYIDIPYDGIFGLDFLGG